MGLPDSLVSSVSDCMNADWAFPPVTMPGMPNFVLSTLAANMAGVNFVLDFIPPTPQILPNIKPPTISLFLDAFMGGIKLPSDYPGFSFGPLTIPGIGTGAGFELGNLPPGLKFDFDLTGLLKLMCACILLPFKLITNMVTDLLQLKITLPTLSGVVSIFMDICASIGLIGDSILDFAGCLARAIVSLFTSLIPV